MAWMCRVQSPGYAALGCFTPWHSANRDLFTPLSPPRSPAGPALGTELPVDPGIIHVGQNFSLPCVPADFCGLKSGNQQQHPVVERCGCLERTSLGTEPIPPFPPGLILIWFLPVPIPLLGKRHQPCVGGGKTGMGISCRNPFTPCSRCSGILFTSHPL